MHLFIAFIFFHLFETCRSGFTLDDDDEIHSTTIASLIALSQRSLLFLEVDLDLSYTDSFLNSSYEIKSPLSKSTDGINM